MAFQRCGLELPVWSPSTSRLAGLSSYRILAVTRRGLAGSGDSKDQASLSKMLCIGSDVFVVSSKYMSDFCNRNHGTIIWNAFCRIGKLM